MRALEWFKRSANSQFVPAEYWLARFYRFGYGVISPDFDACIELLRACVLKGHVRSLRDYAVILLLNGYEGLLGRPKGLILLVKAVVITAILAAKDKQSWRLMF